MAERRGGIYARHDARPYTRKAVRVPKKSYIKGVPHPKIHMFEMGNKKGKFNAELYLIADEQGQIKHNALEAARIAISKYIGKIGSTNYFVKINVYPHHVLRENPLATGAGADRFQEGMRRAFGKPIATAARVKIGQKIITISVNKDKISLGKECLRRAKMKFPIKCRIEIREKKDDSKEI